MRTHSLLGDTQREARMNPMVKPIVHSAEDAVSVLYTSGLDALVSGNITFEK